MQEIAQEGGRLHLLCGESLCSETAQFLKLGTTALVVVLIEAGLAPGDGVELRSPIDSLHTFARDPQCRAYTRSANDTPLSAIAIQRHYLRRAEAQLGKSFMPAWAEDVCRRWGAVLDLLEKGPETVATVLDWAIKLTLFRDRARRRGIEWESLPRWTFIVERLCSALQGTLGGRAPTAELVLGPQSPIPEEVQGLEPYVRSNGLSWDGLRPFLDLRKELFEIDTRFSQLGERGIFTALDRAGALRHHVSGVEAIDEAVATPPRLGRARLRGETIRELARAGCEATASWDGVWDHTGNRSLDLSDPFATRPLWRHRQRKPGDLPLPPSTFAPISMAQFMDMLRGRRGG